MPALRQKISRLAFFDAVGLFITGGCSLLFAVLWRDMVGAGVGIALVTLGGIEWKGRQFLGTGEKRATGWLVGSQLGLLAVILAYCLRGMRYPPELSPDLLAMLQGMPGTEVLGGDLAEVWQALSKVTFSLLMLVSVFYQGSMAFFYLRKTPLALLQPPPLPPDQGKSV